MDGRKSVLRLVAALAVVVAVSIGLELWYSSQVSAAAGGAPVAQACADAPAVSMVRSLCDSRIEAVALRLVTSGLATLVIVALLAVNALARQAHAGRLRFETGCRVGYGIAFWVSCIVALLVMGVVYPLTIQVLVLRNIGMQAVGFDLVVVAFLFVLSAFGLSKLLSNHPAHTLPTPLSVSAWQATQETQPELFSVLCRMSESTGLPMPTNVLLGLDPVVFCTRRTVIANGTGLTGATLHLPLTLCRLLSESEMTSLIVAQMVGSQMVPAEWEAWLIGVGSRWQQIHDAFEGSSLTARSVLFAVMWQWMQVWGGWQAYLLHIGVRRAAVVSGRENTASALAKSAVFVPRWTEYLAEVQAALRSGAISTEQLNLSQRFAERAASPDAKPLPKDNPTVTHWSSVLQVDAGEMLERASRLPAADAALRVAGLNSIEVELSAAQIQRIFFTRPQPA